MPTLVTVGAGAVVLLFLAAPKLAAVLSLVVILLGQSVEQLLGIGVLSYLDESAVALCMAFFTLRRVSAGRRLRRLPGAALFGLYILAGAISSVDHGVPPVQGLAGCFLLVKGPLLALAFAQLDWTPSDVRRAVRIGACGLAFVLITGAINLVVPGIWSSSLALEGNDMTSRIAGLPNLIGPFVHPFAFGQVCALAVAAIVAYRSVVRTGPGSAILLAGATLGTLLSFRRKAIVGMVASAVVARVAVPAKRASAGLVALLVTPAILLVLWDTLVTIAQVTYEDYLVDPTNAARSVMYFDSVDIAIENFPFGVGFARYGSFLAGAYYSPEYQARGYAAVWGLGPETAGEVSFLTDTFWPAILGEAGVLGLLGYAGGLVLLALAGIRLFRGARDPYSAWLGVVLVAWSVEYLVESIASAAYTSPPTFGLLFSVAGIVAALQARSGDAPPPSRAVTRGSRARTTG